MFLIWARSLSCCRNWVYRFTCGEEASAFSSPPCWPNIWRQAKIIALTKPRNDPHLATSYQPLYKLLECIILQRICPTVEDLLRVDQACFCHGRSTCDQATALTTFTENEFEKTLKTGAVFLDLTAAYDTVWHSGLLYKLSKCLPFWCVQTLELLLRNCRFRVHVGDDVSSWRRTYEYSQYSWFLLACYNRQLIDVISVAIAHVAISIYQRCCLQSR